MKNCIIALLAAYIFCTDLCVDRSTPIANVLIWLVIWLSIWAADEWLKDYRKRHKRGNYLVGKIKKMERSWLI